MAAVLPSPHEISQGLVTPGTGWTCTKSSCRPRAADWLSDQGVRACMHSDTRALRASLPSRCDQPCPGSGQTCSGALPITQQPQTARGRGGDSVPIGGSLSASSFHVTFQLRNARSVITATTSSATPELSPSALSHHQRSSPPGISRPIGRMRDGTNKSGSVRPYDRRCKWLTTHRSVEASISEIEDTAVRGNEPIALSVRCGSHAHDGPVERCAAH